MVARMPTDKGIFVSGRVQLLQWKFVLVTPVWAKSLSNSTLSAHTARSQVRITFPGHQNWTRDTFSFGKRKSLWKVRKSRTVNLDNSLVFPGIIYFDIWEPRTGNINPCEHAAIDWCDKYKLLPSNFPSALPPTHLDPSHWAFWMLSWAATETTLESQLFWSVPGQEQSIKISLEEALRKAVFFFYKIFLVGLWEKTVFNFKQYICLNERSKQPCGKLLGWKAEVEITIIF